MTYSRILSAFFICLFFAACDQQEQTEVINNTIEVKTAPEKLEPQKSEPEKTVQQKPRPALNLSVEKMPIDLQTNDKDIFNSNKEPTEDQSEIFKTLSNGQSKPGTNLSGKMVTDEQKIDNEEYLDSIDGVQIKIEGSFQ